MTTDDRDVLLLTAAGELAECWLEGHQIGGDPALNHAIEVVDVLLRHIPTAAPEVIAAAVLHDSPDFAPDDVDLDLTLNSLSPEVARLVRALQHEHDGLALGEAVPPVDDLPLMQASAADKIVSVASVVERAESSHDPAEFWRRRQPFLAGLPYFRAFAVAAVDVLPASMVAELSDLLDRAGGASSE